MEYEIKRLRPEDAGLLSRVAEDVFDADIHPDRLADFLSDSQHAMVIALIDGEVVGQARGIVHLQPDQPHEFYVDNMGVTPRLWRQGIGGRILDELLGWA
jgi:GNAT superfamily N-acetyltransferase